MKHTRPRSELNIYALSPPHLPPRQEDISINGAYFISLHDMYCTFKRRACREWETLACLQCQWVWDTKEKAEQAFEEMPLSVVC